MIYTLPCLDSFGPFFLGSIYEYIPTFYSLFRVKAYQPTACLTSSFPQTEMKDHPISLGTTSGKHIDCPCRYWLSLPESMLQIIGYPNSSWRWVGTGTVCLDRTQIAACETVTLSLYTIYFYAAYS